MGSTAGIAAALGVVTLSIGSAALGQNIDFVGVDGRHFVIAGRPVYFSGTNNYYQMLHRRSGRSADADEVLDKMAARNMNLLRTWAFQDMSEMSPACLICAPVGALPQGMKPVDYINEETFRGLDRTLAAADARKIRVILALVNNWPDYGGMDRWTLWRFGAVDHNQFYIDETIRGWFKEFIALIVNRVNTVNGRVYRDDPTILAWELANEPRASAATTHNLNAWIAEMSGTIKSLDPNHLVTVGIEGFYTGANAPKNTDSWMGAYGQDFIVNHQHATIDFATCHIYPDGWGWNPLGNPEAAKSRAAQFVQQRIDDCDSILRKPLLIEEFGIPRDNRGRGINSGSTSLRDQFFSEVYFRLAEQSATAGGACGGTAMWILFDDHTANYDDGHGIFLPWDASTDALITAHARYLRKLRRGDLDDDGDVDQSDFGRLQACLSGMGQPSPDPNCGPADMDSDGDVDGADLTVFKKCHHGANIPDDPDCVF